MPRKIPSLRDLLGGLNLKEIVGKVSSRSRRSPAAPRQRRKENEDTAIVDRAQRLADLVGIADPTGIVDAGNMALSLARAATEGKERRREHLRNAAISAISIIPLFGDAAKLAKAAPAAGKATKRARGPWRRKPDVAPTSAARPPRTIHQVVGDWLDARRSGAGRGTTTAPTAPRTFRDRVTSGAARAREATSSFFRRSPQQHADRPQPSFREVLAHGTNFGDVMGGLKTPQQARKEMEGEEEEIRQKQRLIEVIKKLTGTFGTLTFGSLALGKTIKAVSEGMISRQRAAGEQLSPGIAAASAQLDVNRLYRQATISAMTSRSFSQLTQSVNRLEDRLVPYQATLTDIGNKILEKLVMATDAVIYIAESVPGFGEYMRAKRDEADIEGKWAERRSFEPMRSISRGELLSEEPEMRRRI